VIVVDHGSRRAEANAMLEEVVRLFGRVTGWPIVEPAHMELAEPTVARAFARCVERGAKTVVCFPYFLAPGRHWDEDIPRLMEEAAADHEGIKWLVTSPLGLHEGIAGVMDGRIRHCLAHTAGEADECDVCAGTGRCVMRGG
jgi:sirohydrochlorin ferrochelatase